MQPHTQQTAMHCIIRHLSLRTKIILFKSPSYSITSVDHPGQPSLSQPWLPMTQPLVHSSSFLAPLLAFIDHRKLTIYHKRCDLGDALTTVSLAIPIWPFSKSLKCFCAYQLVVPSIPKISLGMM